MRHQVKKGLALTLCAVLAALSAVSCGDAGKTMSGGSSQPEVSASSAESSESEAAVEPMKKYDPPITITTVFGEGNFEFPEGEDYGHNDMYQLWEDTMGVHIVNKIQCPATAVKEKMQMAIASNDIPDFGSVDATMLRTLIKNDMVEDMTDIYNTWASDNLKEVTGQSDNALFAPTLKDGRYMALPRANTIGDQLPILFIRSDWLDKLNLDPPKTVEEMFEIAEAFATQDPDGNGIADTYGIQMDKDLSKLPYLLASYAGLVRCRRLGSGICGKRRSKNGRVCRSGKDRYVYWLFLVAVRGYEGLCGQCGGGRLDCCGAASFQKYGDLFDPSGTKHGRLFVRSQGL